ncbi:MAG TPA: DUF1987 domain-containing protein [Bacteroidales bacterium]|nr:DUF1987 domain-containing protein [Bacteroidales bacterium]HPT21373.1 DUF1987 domain-containing protein [Bacteroidales bacterium]
MQKLHIPPTSTTPEICFSPEDNTFMIRGTSSPEDVRALYYPVIEWARLFIDELIEKKSDRYSKENPLRLQIDSNYFNSSSAKFFYDILLEFKRLAPFEIPLVVEWFYDKEDIDLQEAGSDIALLANMEFTFITKN